MNAIDYRREIDGLRALAVLPILLYHAGIPGFPGGYVGVDVFFVISGYLITSIIARQLSDGTFSYAGFYERRLRRIFPALAAMLLFCLLAACFILLPSEVPDFAKSVIGTVLFASNIAFYRQSGYFDAAGEIKPLLHTWSLGVEEQFYILFPILLFLVHRYLPRYRRSVLALCAGLSLALCIYLTPDHASAAFYLIPTRAWELFAGSLVALGAMPKLGSARARDGLALLGVALIVSAILLLDDKVPFPGVAALLPVAGSVLVVAYGEGTMAGRLLSFRPLAFVGLISYSVYLWHWPLIVFGRDLRLVDGGTASAAAAVLASLLVGYLSYRFIETPFRDRARFNRRSIYWLAAIGSGALLAAGIAALRSDGLRWRYSGEVLAFDDGARDTSPLRETCHRSAGKADPASACIMGGTVADTALWGDSHGVELSYALATPAHPIRSLTYSACPPAAGVTVADRPDCEEHNRLVARYLHGTPEIRTIIIAAFLSFQMERPGFARGLVESVDGLVKAGKSVVVIGPLPVEGAGHLPRRLARWGDFRIPVQDYGARQRRVIALLTLLQARGARIVWPSDHLCDARSCAVSVEGRPLLFDDHHLSMTGARYLARRIAPSVWRDEAQAVVPAAPVTGER